MGIIISGLLFRDAKQEISTRCSKKTIIAYGLGAEEQVSIQSDSQNKKEVTM